MDQFLYGLRFGLGFGAAMVVCIPLIVAFFYAADQLVSQIEF